MDIDDLVDLYIDDLLKTGLYGGKRAQVIETLVLAEIRQAVADGIINLRELEEPAAGDPPASVVSDDEPIPL